MTKEYQGYFVLGGGATTEDIVEWFDDHTMLLHQEPTGMYISRGNIPTRRVTSLEEIKKRWPSKYAEFCEAVVWSLFK